MNPIFICGFPKSGTTLLAKLFSNLPSVHIDTELHVATHVLKMVNDIPKSGAIKTDLLDPLSFRLAQLAENDWQLYYDHVRELFQKLHTGHEFEWRWGNNCKPNIDYVPILKRLYPNCTVIYLLRDPRDVWASVKHAKWPGQKYFTELPYFTQRFREVYEKSQNENVHTVLYRDLITNPQQAFDLIDEKFHPSLLVGTGKVFQYRTLPMKWDQTFSDGLLQTQDKRYKKELSSDEISQIEHNFSDIIKRYDFGF